MVDVLLMYLSYGQAGWGRRPLIGAGNVPAMVFILGSAAALPCQIGQAGFD
jgi:hypothetical protein